MSIHGLSRTVVLFLAVAVGCTFGDPRIKLARVDPQWCDNVLLAARLQDVERFVGYKPWCGNDLYFRQRYEHMANQRPLIEYTIYRYAVETYRMLALYLPSNLKNCPAQLEKRLEVTRRGVELLATWRSPTLMVLARQAAMLAQPTNDSDRDALTMWLDPFHRVVEQLADSTSQRCQEFATTLAQRPRSLMRQFAR